VDAPPSGALMVRRKLMVYAFGSMGCSEKLSLRHALGL
jgi:hypothetical protein